MNIFITKAEALRRAQAWIDKQSPDNNSGWDSSAVMCVGKDLVEPANIPYDFHFKESNGGGCGGLVIVVPHGEDDEGMVLAIEDFTGESKKFFWKDDRS